MATIRTYSPEYSDRVRQDNLTKALSGVSTQQPGTPSDHYIYPAGPVQAEQKGEFGFAADAPKGFYNPNASSPAPTTIPASSTTPEPTIGEQLTGIQNEALRIQDILDQRRAEEEAAAAGSGFQTPTYQTYPSFDEIYGAEVDPDKEYQRMLRMFQDQIDATNTVYDNLLSEERLRGEGRLGTQRAIAARGGLLGSDFAGSQKSKVQDYNTAQQRSIQAERTAAIGAILGTARQSAQQEIANKRAARQQGAENYLNYLANSQANRTNNIATVAGAFVAQGIDPTELDETELQSIASEIGANPADIITAYKASLAKPESDNQFTLSSGEQRYDAQGNLIAEGPAATPDQGKIYSTSQGLVRIDPTTGQPTLIFASGSGSGGTTSVGETFKSGGATFSGSDVAALQNALNATRGEDGHVNSQAYLDSLADWTASQGLEEDFFKLFPPKNWIDPNDTSVPQRIRDKANTSSDPFASLFGGYDMGAVNDTGPVVEEEDGGWFSWLGF